MMCSLLKKLLLHGRLVPRAHETGGVEPGGLLEVLPAHLGLPLPLSRLRHALREVLGAGVEVHDDGEVDLGLQAGRGADRHAGALALDAQMGFPHAGQRVPLLLLLRVQARLRPPVPELPLGTEGRRTTALRLQNCSRRRDGEHDMELDGGIALVFEGLPVCWDSMADSCNVP